MNYAWDPNKALENVAKHAISFADAVAVLSDPFARTVEDEASEEERFVTIGSDAFGQIVVVVSTWRGEDTIRLISARRATRQERRSYEG